MEKMSNEKLQELGLKLYVLKPSTKTFGGIEITKETEFEDMEIVEDNDEERGAQRKTIIEQTLKNFVLTTKRVDLLVFPNYKNESTSLTEQVLSTDENAKVKLVFIPEEGWGIPNREVCPTEEALRDLELVKNK